MTWFYILWALGTAGFLQCSVSLFHPGCRKRTERRGEKEQKEVKKRGRMDRRERKMEEERKRRKQRGGRGGEADPHWGGEEALLRGCMQ